jgi:hypothetical protein
VQEVELGLAADVGTLQRLPKIVGNERFIVLKFFKLIQLKLDLKSNFSMMSLVFLIIIKIIEFL